MTFISLLRGMLQRDPPPWGRFDKEALNKTPPPTRAALKHLPPAEWRELRAARFAEDHFGASLEQFAARRNPGLAASQAIGREYTIYRRKWPAVRAEEAQKAKAKKAKRCFEAWSRDARPREIASSGDESDSVRQP